MEVDIEAFANDQLAKITKLSAKNINVLKLRKVASQKTTEQQKSGGQLEYGGQSLEHFAPFGRAYSKGRMERRRKLPRSQTYKQVNRGRMWMEIK